MAIALGRIEKMMFSNVRVKSNTLQVETGPFDGGRIGEDKGKAESTKVEWTDLCLGSSC